MDEFGDSNVRTERSMVPARSSITVAHDALEQALASLQEVVERLENHAENFMRPDSRSEAPAKASLDGANPDASREQNMVWNASRIVTQVTERLRSINDRIDY